MKVAVAGFSGLIGTHLVKHLQQKGYEVIPIAHKGDKLELDHRHLDVDAVINLSGQNIMHRWSESFKQHALQSRAGTSHDINHFYDDKAHKPKVFISASAIGYYGSCPGETLIETSPKGVGFLSDLCEKWEMASFDSPIHRVVVFRLGLVLAEDSGVAKNLVKQVKRGLGAVFGKGQEALSWVHIDDVVKAMTHALERSSYQGVYNLVSESTTTQKGFQEALAKTYGKKVWLKLPRFLLKLILGEASSVILSDLKVYPKNLKLSGYDFLYPDLESALYSLKTRGL